MNRTWLTALVAALALAASGSGAAEEGEGRRNPFNVPDVADPQGDDVRTFAAKVKLAGEREDANAWDWAPEPVAGRFASLEGEWSSRWGGGVAGDEWFAGTATVKVSGDRVFILYKDKTGEYLIEARREGPRRLIGRYADLRTGGGGSPWVGLVVNDQRIDGAWNLGRWDLRRTIGEK